MGKDRTDPYREVLAPLLEPIVASAKQNATMPASKKPPSSRSPVIAALTWAPKTTIVRKGEGSDNWLTT